LFGLYLSSNNLRTIDVTNPHAKAPDIFDNACGSIVLARYSLRNNFGIANPAIIPINIPFMIYPLELNNCQKKGYDFYIIANGTDR